MLYEITLQLITNISFTPSILGGVFFFPRETCEVHLNICNQENERGFRSFCWLCLFKYSERWRDESDHRLLGHFTDL